MSLRAKLARLEKAMQGNLSSIELTDGSRYWFDPQETGIVLFLYLMDSSRTVYSGSPRPEPPELLRAVAAAKNQREAFSGIRAAPAGEERSQRRRGRHHVAGALKAALVDSTGSSLWAVVSRW